jgi:hypothetical protein
VSVRLKQARQPNPSRKKVKEVTEEGQEEVLINKMSDYM